MTWQQLWFDSTWKSLKRTQAGPWEWYHVNIQDTWTWETILKRMLKNSKVTLEDLTFQGRITVPVFSRPTDLMLFDFCIQNINFCNFSMRVLKRQRLLGHPINCIQIFLSFLKAWMFPIGKFVLTVLSWKMFLTSSSSPSSKTIVIAMCVTSVSSETLLATENLQWEKSNKLFGEKRQTLSDSFETVI